jgi:hypothetical protein
MRFAKDVGAHEVGKDKFYQSDGWSFIVWPTQECRLDVKLQERVFRLFAGCNTFTDTKRSYVPQACLLMYNNDDLGIGFKTDECMLLRNYVKRYGVKKTA